MIEDLHWADETSLEFLLTFARRVASGAPSAICLLLTFRSDEMHPALTHLLAELERAAWQVRWRLIYQGLLGRERRSLHHALLTAL